MQRTAQIDFAFNINDFARSHARQASDPAGFAERQLAEFKHGQTVDLPDNGAVRINQNVYAAFLQRRNDHFIIRCDKLVK